LKSGVAAAMGEALAPADLLAILLGLAAAIGCVNYFWIRLPPAIGMLLGSLALSALVVGSDHILHLHIMRWFRGTLAAANLPHFFLDGALALLLFAGGLHVDIKELNRRRWLILLLATASVVLSTSIFGAGMWLPIALLPIAVAIPLAVISRAVSVAIPLLLTRDSLRNKARDSCVQRTRTRNPADFLLGYERNNRVYCVS
jgi:Na+:H+ antiporter